ncbi:MAG: hypothetical protein GX579_14580 [Chloroflexi bacterium]|nr:hypothetical protein [Chloroflexota bacterium]
MDDWIWILLVVVALAALIWYQRRQPRPRGTYDDEDVRSSGSIGGSRTGAYDEEDVRSSGSIGGSREGAYDDDETTSGGSIGR